MGYKGTNYVSSTVRKSNLDTRHKRQIWLLAGSCQTELVHDHPFARSCALP